MVGSSSTTRRWRPVGDAEDRHPAPTVGVLHREDGIGAEHDLDDFVTGDAVAGDVGLVGLVAQQFGDHHERIVSQAYYVWDTKRFLTRNCGILNALQVASIGGPLGTTDDEIGPSLGSCGRTGVRFGVEPLSQAPGMLNR